MKRTVLSAAVLAFVLGLGISFAAPTAVMAAEGKKAESPCAKMTDKKEKAACLKKEAAAKKAKK
ncbi:MAG: hypothetical protein COW30_07825 [Rhodospirillales bacterium CG15_BIG_FIL_POST_REV_8_21_14_020_66_15]|nr:MAG: hypothetical protein COW30_07825 [Rhodospirillales bacterium CG15_BIG_FIL_POST_REV_8_21_14_020_66_15]